MAFGNNKQNNSTELSINTRGNQFFNDSENGSTLITGFWNSFLTLKICPTLPKDKRSDNKKYNYDTFVNTAITPEKARVLLLAIDKLILPRISRGDYDFQSVGISVGSGFVEISNGAKHNKPESSICVTVYNKIDSEGKTNEYLTYEFNQLPFFTDYDNKTGNIARNVDQGEFMLFVTILQEAVKAMTNAIAHSIKNVNKYGDERHKNNINNIMQKLGVEFNDNKNNGGYKPKPSGFFDNPSLNTDQGLEDNDIQYGTIVDGGRLPM